MTDARVTRRGLMGMVALPLLAGVAQAAQPRPSGLVEPHMHMEGAASGAPVVALTFDACDGHTDMRILNMMVDQGVSATIFTSGPWLRGNAGAMKALLSRPDLFEIGDHGALHHAAIDRDMTLWGVRSCGSVAGVAAEVREGAALIEAAGGGKPAWFRGATAYYSPAAMQEIEGMGFRVAGFSINGDEGASLGAAETRRRYLGAKHGDVLISHINQPLRAAGAGVVAGVLALKARGYRFVKLSDPAIRVSRAA